MRKQVMRNWMTVIFIMLTVSIVQLASAQKPSEGRERRSHHNRELFRGKKGMNSEKAHEMMMSMKIWKLTEELKIDEKLAEKFYPRVRELEQFRFDTRKEFSVLTDQLRELISTPDYDRNQLESLIGTLKEKQQALHAVEIQKMESIMGLLTLEQQARFILVEQEFHQDVRRFLREHKGRKRD